MHLLVKGNYIKYRYNNASTKHAALGTLRGIQSMIEKLKWVPRECTFPRQKRLFPTLQLCIYLSMCVQGLRTALVFRKFVM